MTSSSKKDDLCCDVTEDDITNIVDFHRYYRYFSNLPKETLQKIKSTEIRSGRFEDLDIKISEHSEECDGSYLHFLRELRQEFTNDRTDEEAYEAFLMKTVTTFFSRFPDPNKKNTTNDGKETSDTSSLQQLIDEVLASPDSLQIPNVPPSTVTCPSVYNYDSLMYDIHTLYIRGLEAHIAGRYREIFNYIRPTLPFLATNPMTWIRISEACLFEIYEGNWDFYDLYERLFQDRERHFIPCNRRQINDLRPRHHDMSMKFTECATTLAWVMAKQTTSNCLHLTSAQNRIFLMLKLRKYQEALDTLSWVIVKSGKKQVSTDQMALFLLYKAEAVMFMGNLNRAIEYSLKVDLKAIHPKIKMRAKMICAMAYIKKKNYLKALEFVMIILETHILDDMMLENVALLGIDLAHKMNNTAMMKHFISLLQEAVY